MVSAGAGPEENQAGRSFGGVFECLSGGIVSGMVSPPMGRRDHRG